MKSWPNLPLLLLRSDAINNMIYSDELLWNDNCDVTLFQISVNMEATAFKRCFHCSGVCHDQGHCMQFYWSPPSNWHYINDRSQTLDVAQTAGSMKGLDVLANGGTGNVLKSLSKLQILGSVCLKLVDAWLGWQHDTPCLTSLTCSGASLKQRPPKSTAEQYLCTCEERCRPKGPSVHDTFADRFLAHVTLCFADRFHALSFSLWALLQRSCCIGLLEAHNTTL